MNYLTHSFFGGGGLENVALILELGAIMNWFCSESKGLGADGCHEMRVYGTLSLQNFKHYRQNFKLKPQKKKQKQKNKNKNKTNKNKTKKEPCFTGVTHPNFLFW